MSKVENIEKEIQNLSTEELSELRIWFQRYDSAIWDQEIERDVHQGKLDALRDEALAEHQNKRTTQL